MKELNIVSLEEAVALVKSNDNVFFQGAAMTPTILIDALCERYKELENIEIYQIHTHGEAKYLEKPYNKAFHLSSLFVGDNVRRGINSESGDYIPIFLSGIQHLFRSKMIALDVAFVQVSPPDEHGFCSLGTSVDVALPATEMATNIIAQVNPNVPRTHGDGFIHVRDIDLAVELDEPIEPTAYVEPSTVEKKIGKYVADLIEDKSTLQMGIGTIPNAVLNNLHDHNGLGVHTEMFSDGLLPLVEKGVITGEHKANNIGKIITSFALGSPKLFDFVDDNPQVFFKETGYTNDTVKIRANPKVIAINSALEIDLTGQVCADSIGTYQYSGVGGQMDFIHGAALSKGGKPIFALPSVTKKGISKIVPYLNKGASVTTTRAHVQYIVTEYGVVNLYGKSLKERAKLLTSIAHPDHREGLEKSVYERFCKY